ncbi:MAG: L,D-transpeptidase family protein [Phycisphaerales bacterium]|nr:L,D-transpeptidase family protein [Phycisphaerales bacterium]MCB9835189.1 L,D-transpeptidase family protein [Phycisphaera sp.]
MPLPSQSRSFGSRTSRRRRRKKGPPKAVFIVPVVLVGLVSLYWLFGGSGDETPKASSDGSLVAAADDALVDPVISDPIVRDPVREESPKVETQKPVVEKPTHETLMLGASRTETNESMTNETHQTPPPPTVREETTNSQPVTRPANDLPQEDPIAQPVSTGVAALLDRATAHLNRGELVSARAVLNDALMSPQAGEADKARIREELATVNQELFFGTKVYPGDTLSEMYEIQSGDSLARITSRQSLTVDWRLIQRVNRINDPSRIRVGQKIKLVRGPLHAVVDKSEYRLDLYAGPPGAPSQWMYIRSFPVGLGEGGSTPLGEFVVRSDSKLINPVWRNPRTGEFFAADNPENPIGERWVGIEGVGQYASLDGYGIHGTIDPSSIGKDASMGCVRMNDGDVEIVYESLVEQVSQVIIKP